MNRSLQARLGYFLVVGVMASFALTFLMVGRPAAAAPFVMKLGTATINDQQYEWLKRFKVAVERDSKARISVEIYPASQLGSIPREIEDTQFGAIQGWIGPTEFLVGIDPRYQTLSAPGVFATPQQANRTYQDPVFSRALLGLGASKGLKGLSLMYYGQNGVVTRRAARTLSDFKDMRIRDSGGDMQQLMLRALGIVGLPMPLDQVLPALQQGAIEGVMMTIPAATTLKLYDAAKYFTDFAVSTVTAIVVINKSWFDKLPLDLKRIVAIDGQTVGRELLPFTLNFTEQENNAWKAGGGEIVHLPASDASQIRSLEGNVPGRVIEGKQDLKQFYDLLVKTAEKYRQ